MHLTDKMRLPFRWLRTLSKSDEDLYYRKMNVYRIFEYLLVKPNSVNLQFQMLHKKLNRLRYVYRAETINDEILTLKSNISTKTV